MVIRMSSYYIRICIICWMLYRTKLIYLFYQAEDGIRYIGVTGVQTCALPIYWDDHHQAARAHARRRFAARRRSARGHRRLALRADGREPPRDPLGRCAAQLRTWPAGDRKCVVLGKRVDLGGRRIIKIKHVSDL